MGSRRQYQAATALALAPEELEKVFAIRQATCGVWYLFRDPLLECSSPAKNLQGKPPYKPRFAAQQLNERFD
jgi:hypothetical protein